MVLEDSNRLGPVAGLDGIDDRGVVTARHEVIVADAEDGDAYPTLQVPPSVDQYGILGQLAKQQMEGKIGVRVGAEVGFGVVEIG